MITNIPEVKVGIVAVSRNSFPEELSIRRRSNVVLVYTEKFGQQDIYECPICVMENEANIARALRDLNKAGCNALCIYLGNFGPEIVETMLAQRFEGPVMFCAAAEETQSDLTDQRGDAYCGLLNASYSLALRKVKAYIPEEPVGDAKECAELIHDFVPIARAVIGVKNLKIISFGPRPYNFIACNAPIQPLYDLGIEVEENSELDLYEYYKKHDNDVRIQDIIADMKKELGDGNCMELLLPRLAQLEVTILDWVRNHRGAKKYVALTLKCWPAFSGFFEFVPCYINGRLTRSGIPVSCEVDLYGALSEYIGICLGNQSVTILDINNTVPKDMYFKAIQGRQFNDGEYDLSDTFMAFHCGNVCTDCLCSHEMKPHTIMSKALPKEQIGGIIEGDLLPGNITLFRLQSTAKGKLRSYIAEGEILPVKTKSYGAIGIFAVHQMGRFYRHVLLEKNYPHHGAVAFAHCGEYLFEVFKLLGIKKIDYPHDKEQLYKSENPFRRRKKDGNHI